MHDLQRRLPRQLTAGAVEVRHGNPQPVRQILDLDVLAISLFHQLNKAVEVFPGPLRSRHGGATLDHLAADPHHDHADQRMHEHFPRRLMAGVFVLQGAEQAVEVLGVLACRVAFGLGQGIDRLPQLHLQVGDQRRGQGHDKPFHVLGKAKAVHRQRWQDLDRRLHQLRSLAFDFKLCLTFEYEEQLAQVSMAVRFDFPMMFATAFGNGFTVQQVRGRPIQAFTVELEHWNRRQVRLVHHFNPGLGVDGGR
ncbi:hypothetical protein D3C86_1296190 [compost metagenome]